MFDYPCPQYTVPIITEANLTALISSMSKGVKTVQYADKKIEYQSIDDMMKIYRWMLAQLNPCGAGITKVAAYYESGLGGPCGTETEEHSFRTR